jgi:hypothetical protein
MNRIQKDLYSSENKSNSTASGISFSSILFIVFLVLKLTGTIDWSWWWVTAPLWIPVGLVLIIALVILVLAK